MKPTQNNRNSNSKTPQSEPVVHRMPHRYKSDFDRITNNAPKQTKQTNMTQNKRPDTRKPSAPNVRTVRRKKKKKLSFIEALFEELGEGGINLGVPVTAEQLIRSGICAVLIVFFAMLQTTVFTEFKPFGAVPDLMFCMTVAIAFSEGEKWGSVCGLISAVIIDSLGGVGITLLPLLYTVVGYICGYLVRDFFSNTSLPRVAVILLFAVLRSAVTMISASVILGANLIDIMVDKVLPEYFSTVVMSAPVYLIVWLCFVRFHKTRAERTS